MTRIEALKVIRQRKKMSYREVSEETGASWRTVYRWFAGESLPSKLAVPIIDDFIDRHEECLPDEKELDI